MKPITASKFARQFRAEKKAQDKADKEARIAHERQLTYAIVSSMTAAMGHPPKRQGVSVGLAGRMASAALALAFVVLVALSFAKAYAS